MKESRNYPRTPLAVLLEIWSGDRKKNVGKGFITNLSEGGLALETTVRLKLKENFLLRFTLPNGWTFDLWGNILHTKPGVLIKTYGVQFKKVQAEERAKIRHFVLASLNMNK
ncbi:MAG: PilZ domain-containing protein [Elusimicrobiota bacterium]